MLASSMLRARMCLMTLRFFRKLAVDPSCTQQSEAHPSIQTCMHTYIHTCMHASIHTYIHTCMHTYIHTYIHVRTFCTYEYVETCVHIQTYIHTPCTPGNSPPQFGNCVFLRQLQSFLMALAFVYCTDIMANSIKCVPIGGRCKSFIQL